jgi:pullulanase
MRRWALLMLLGVYVLCCAPLLAEEGSVGGVGVVAQGVEQLEAEGSVVAGEPGEPGGLAEPGVVPVALGVGKTAVDFGGKTVLIVHYRREAAEYAGWNVWAWPVNAEGAEYGLSGSDAFGLYAVVVFDEAQEKLGFIIRRGDWEQKDGDRDRMIEVGAGGVAEVWVLEGRMPFDTTPPRVDEAQDARAVGVEGGPGVVGTVSAAPESAASVGAGAVAVLHYYRPDGKYDDWGVWAWAEGEDGEVYAFDKVDGYGVFAEVKLDEPTDRVGFLIRRGEWLERDVDMDRYVSPNESGVVEAWLLSGEEKVFMDPTKLDYALQIQRAFLDSPDVLHVRLNQPVRAADVSEPAGWVEVQGERYPVSGVKAMGHGEAGSRDLVLKLRRGIDLDKMVSGMTLSLPGVGPATVYAREVLTDDRFHDLDAALGSDYTATATAFATWSPVAERVELLLFKSADVADPYETVAMSKGHGSVWRARVEGDLDGIYYMYRFTSYGEERTVADIYCYAASKDSSRSMVVDLDKTDPPGWDQDVSPVSESPVDEVIYEIHVRDFSVADESCPPGMRGKYLGLAHENPGDIATGVSHLKELGVTTVHLLPIQDFSAGMDEYNWGYWTALFNVAEAQYSTNPDDPAQAIRDLKTMIKAMHDAGIRVVLDVVYNHTSTSFSASPFDQAVPWYYFRTTPGGRLRNESGTGNAIADERPMARKYIIDSLKYWVREYHVDGFRFDLLGMMHKESVRQIEKELHAERADLLIYGEPWTGGGPTHFPKGAQKKMGVAVFNDHLRNAIRGDLDGVALGFAMGGGHEKEIRDGLAGAIDDFAEHPTESISYVSAHDNRTLWDKLTHTLPDADDATKRAMQKLSLGIVLTSQGVAFLHGGSDFARTKLGNHNSYNAGDEVNKFDWPRKAEYRDVFDYTRGLIALRREHPAFRLRTRKQVRAHMSFHDGPGPIWYQVDGGAVGDDWSTILVAYNGDAEGKRFVLPEGSWSVVVDHERAGVETIGEASGEVLMRPFSMMVLYRD